MPNTSLKLVSALALVAVTSAGIGAPLGAQEPVRLAFGYQCDNRFVLQNEGTYGVEVAYAVIGTDEGGRLSIDAGQTLAFEPQTLGDVEILVDDRVVATAENTGLSCQPNVVVVRPLYHPNGGVTVIQPYAYGRPTYFARPLVRVVVPRPSLFGSFLRGLSRSPAWNGGWGGRDRDDYRGGRPQSGYRPDSPRSGYRPDSPRSGYRPDGPRSGYNPGRANGGNGANRPQAGGRAGRPQDGNRPERSQNGNGAGRSQKEPRTAHPRDR